MLYTRRIYFVQLPQFGFYLELYPLQTREIVVITSNFRPKWKLRNPKNSMKPIFTILIYVKYLKTSHFVVFVQFRFYIGLYQLKNHEIGVFTPSFGVKTGHKDP